ncbi:TIGR03862 family flavoprotein [Yoonia litorea]|uniref:TIGR03862 family flavoprotein n=1 Tax=Yoonia litorea TaxID=1123755 RepID=A0A1I6MWT4_9RHOB|nr:TIGR03862 family flavoprotein [Yoonia litorea]SFS20160.1 hypothetical protein SAMN05444714_2503 [Yoonia litorea]
MTDAVVIGAGPAGLMAAEMLGQAGVSVILADAMPSVGRKFLMAGKSGLNLTKHEAVDQFFMAYGDDLPEALSASLAEFGPDDVMKWAEGLGQSLFVGSTGRVFPKVMKASPLLRAWLARLDGFGVQMKTRWRWQGWDDERLMFESPDGTITCKPKITVLALGGASWARLGSDGAWVQHLPHSVSDFAPANMGFEVDWSAHMARFFGLPVKSVALRAGDTQSRGEFVISERGLEGGGIYSVSRAMREGATLYLDLLPDRSEADVRKAMKKPRGKASLTNHLRKVLRLDPVRIGLLQEFGRPFPDDITSLIKALPVTHSGPRPMDEAISTAGGLRFNALDRHLMITDRPGVFCAGEMLDWEAPTGGYLITGCLATGRRAGQAAARFALGSHVQF